MSPTSSPVLQFVPFEPVPNGTSPLPDEPFYLDSRKAAKDAKMSLGWTQCILKLHCSINDRLTDWVFIHPSVLAS